MRRKKYIYDKNRIDELDNHPFVYKAEIFTNQFECEKYQEVEHISIWLDEGMIFDHEETISLIVDSVAQGLKELQHIRPMTKEELECI